MTFTDTDLLLLALVLPLMIAICVWRYVRRRRRVAHALGEARLLARLGAAGLERFPVLRLALLLLAGIALGIAAAGPRWGVHELPSESRARNIVLAIDISKSMFAQDVQPNRLERERLLARRVLRELAADRIGLVVFAGRAYILSPLTTDHGALNLYVDALDPDMVSQGGSSIAAALNQAADLARGPSGRARGAAVVLMSDGEVVEEGDEEVTQAARRASRLGVVVHTLGIGTEEGARIPDYEPGTRKVIGWKTDPYDRIVISRLNERVLRGVAQETGGQYLRMEQPGATGVLLRQLRDLQRTSGQQESRTERQDRTAWFVALALLLLVLDLFVARRMDRVSAALSSRGFAGLRPVAALLLLVLVGWGIGELERGNSYYRAGKYEDAVREYEKALRAGKDSPELRYNLGTALLKLGRGEVAQEHFARAVKARDPDVRQRVHFNTGYHALEVGRQGGEAAPERLAAAVESYKRALRLNPTDVDAKWNLELALREQEKQKKQQGGGQNQPQSGGGGADDSQAQGRQGGAGSAPNNQPSGQGRDQGMNMQQRPMSREQADRILSAIEQDERELTREKLKKGQRRTAVGRDW